MAVVWPDGEGPGSAAELLAEFRSAYRPRFVLAGGPEGCSTPALLEGRRAIDGRPAAFVCRDFSCRAPGVGTA